MTEDEAKTKVCFRAATFAASQQIADGPGPLCIGSACMAWRLGPVEYGPIVERIPARAGSRKPEGEGWGYESPGENPQGGPDWARRTVTRPGFCGLAGAPS